MMFPLGGAERSVAAMLMMPCGGGTTVNENRIFLTIFVMMPSFNYTLFYLDMFGQFRKFFKRNEIESVTSLSSTVLSIESYVFIAMHSISSFDRISI